MGISANTRTRTQRISLVVSHLKGGGKEQCVVNLANSLFEEGVLPLIVCLETGGILQNELRYPDIKVFELNKRKGNDIRVPFRLAKLLKKEKVDIVHSNNWGTLLECVVARKIAGIRHLVHTQHGMDYGMEASRSKFHERVRRLVKQIACRWITQVVAVSLQVKEMVMKEWHAPPGKVTVINNGIYINGKAPSRQEIIKKRNKLGLKESDFVIGSIGFFRPVKDFPTVIRSMAHIIEKVPQSKLVLIGDGESKKEIEYEIERFHLWSHIHLLGWRSDVKELFPTMDVFVSSSISEGISLSILEAMSSEIPVVATSVGGNPEIINDRKTGVLIPPRSPEMLADQIILLFEDLERRKTMGRHGRDRVEKKFSVKRMAGEYIKVYRELLN